MAKLEDLIHRIGSKNAGPFKLTVDIYFDQDENYSKVKDSGAINHEIISRAFGIHREMVNGIYYLDDLSVIKISMKRPVPAGHPLDSDVYGAQQHKPLLDIEI